MWHQVRPPVRITCHVSPIAQMLVPAKILGHSVPSASWTTNTAMPACTSTSKRGTTNSPEVDGQHTAPGSDAFPNVARTNVSANIVEQIVQPVHSSHARFHAKVMTSVWQEVGRPRSFRNATSILLSSFLKIARCPAAKQTKSEQNIKA